MVTTTSTSTAAMNPKRKSLYSGVVVWVLAAALACRFYWVVSRYAVNLFFFDEWDIYGGLFQGWPWWRFFLQQHGPHRQGLGVIVVVWLLRASRWDSRMQAYAIATAIVLAMIFALLLKIKNYGPLNFFDIIIPVMFLGLGQWEVLLSAPGLSPQAFPLLLLVAYCLAWVQPKSGLRYLAIPVLNFLLIFTGYGIFVAVITLLLLAMDGWQTWKAGQRVASPLWAWMASAVSLAFFFHGYEFSPAAGCFQFPYARPAAYPWFIGLMFAKFLGIKHGELFPAIVGIAITVVMIAVWGRSAWLMLRSVDPGKQVPVILTGYTLLYAAAAAVGRLCLGMEAAESSRNTTLLIPGFFGIYVCLLSLHQSQKRTWLLAALLAAVLPSCVQRNHKEIEGFSARKSAWANCYRTTENIDACDASSKLQIYPQPEAIHLRKKLDFLKQNRLNLYASSAAEH